MDKFWEWIYKRLGKKVFVVWHLTFERVEAVHLTEAGAQKYIEENWDPEDIGRFEYDEFEVKP